MEIKQAEFSLSAPMVTMLLTKPEPKEHYDAMIGLAQSVVDQELTSWIRS